MTNEPENIDDELLSAYLDNELALEERVRVDARLASDPAARQLLDELRSVSHAVKGLPKQPLGADIRDTVLRRAERAMLSSKAGDPNSAGGSSLDDTSPRFTIGRSLRGWIWAGLATAAALAIMAFESNSNREAQLPETVAKRDAEPAGEVKPAPELRAIVKSERLGAASVPVASPIPELPATPQHNAGSSVLADSKSALRDAHELSTDNSRYAAAAPRQSGPDGSQVAGDKQAVVSTAAGGEVVHGTQFAFDAGAATPGNVDSDLLVVHLQVKPGAFKSGAFEHMLLDKGIAMEDTLDQSAAAPLAAPKSPTESTAPSSAPGAQAGNLAVNSRPRQLDEALSNIASTADTDLFLVEAPKQQIESCLTDIHKDDQNYLGVAVDEKDIVKKKMDGVDASETNWGQYSRGVVPRRQTLERSANNDYILQTEQGAIAINRGLNGGSGAQQATEQLERKEDNNNVAQQRGRAVRMRTQNQSQDNIADRLGGNARALRLDARNAPQSTAGAALRDFGGSNNKNAPQQQTAPPADDTLQVLFILNSDKQPAAAPAPAETKAAK
jgi:anti-sigma factor RsiW